METELGLIFGKTHDYKRCKDCGCFNWYENEECHNCSEKKFKEVEQEDLDYEYKFWESEGEEEPFNAIITI